MADMPNDFWSGWIILLTVFSLAGLTWLVLSVFFLPPKKINLKERTVWDEDLQEDTNPIPLWWFWLLLSMMIFTAAYLMLYPGLGSFSGAFRWSQGGELAESVENFDTEFAEINAVIVASSIAELQARPEVMSSAANLFNENCSACHGYEAQGQLSLFPNLRDDEWLWGDTPEQIEQTIRNGRIAAMISWQAVLTDEGVENVSDYVLTALGTDAAEGHPGQAQYNLFCVACHGAAGQGNPLFGAPNLTNDIWFYGGSEETVRETISQGRMGEMPAFASRLDDAQIRMLVAWLSPE
jgi:cytochrome c oxidase cbb3-type subunit III